MQSGSWASYMAATPPEARPGGEPDDYDTDCEGAPDDTPDEWTCTTCGERAPGCICDRAAMADALRDENAARPVCGSCGFPTDEAVTVGCEGCDPAALAPSAGGAAEVDRG